MPEWSQTGMRELLGVIELLHLEMLRKSLIRKSIYTQYLQYCIIFIDISRLHSASLVAQTVKHLPAMQETQVLSLGWEDPLEKGRLRTPVFLPGELHGQRSLVGYSPWSFKESDMTV